MQIPNVDVSLECGYYNLAYRGTDIVIDELQRCIATKTTGQNNIFLAEYKVIDTESIWMSTKSMDINFEISMHEHVWKIHYQINIIFQWCNCLREKQFECYRNLCTT